MKDYTAADRDYLLKASRGQLDQDYTPSDEQEEEPDIKPHELLAFSVPTEGGTGSGSGAEGSEQAEHPLAPLAAPVVPPAEGPSTNEAVPSPTVSVSGSGESNATQAPPIAPTPADAPALSPPTAPVGLVSHDPNASASASAQPRDPIGRLPFPAAPAAPKPPDYSGVQTWQDRLEAAQREQIEAIGRGDHSTADALQRFKDEHAAMVRANQQANEEAHQQMLAQKAAQDKRWEAFQSKDIDPDHYVHNMSGWQKALALAAVTLGGALEGFQGTPNRAMDAFQGAIARDIDAQKANFERDARVLQHGDNLYAQNYQMYRDEQAARAATEADHWKMAQWELENLKNASNDAAQKAAYEMAAAQTNQKYEEAMTRAGVQTALVKANKLVAESKKQAEALQAQALGGIATGPGYARATGQPMPKPAAGHPAAAATKTQAAAAKAAEPSDSSIQVRSLEELHAKESDLKPYGKDKEGNDLYILPATALDKVTGMRRGRLVVARPSGYTVSTLPVDYQEEAPKSGKAGGGPRFSSRMAIADEEEALGRLSRLEAGLKVGRSGAEANADYQAARHVFPELPDIDLSSWDPADKRSGALDRAINIARNKVATHKKLLEQYGDQSPAAEAPEQ